MLYVIAIAGGFIGGVFAVLGIFNHWRVKTRKVLKRMKRLDDEERQLRADSAEAEQLLRDLNNRAVTREELEQENATVKRDLHNVGVSMRKLRMDAEKQAESQVALNEQCVELTQRYMKDVRQWINRSLTPNNYSTCKKRLEKTIGWCRKAGLELTEVQEHEMFDELQKDFEMEVRAQIEKEEQNRIKAQIRDEERREREIAKELKEIEAEQVAIERAIKLALNEAKGEHDDEVQRLEALLAEAQEKNKRAISQAQQTRAGHVYVISNVGSFGDGICKIGMTRRLNPDDRVKELSDASVPFSFDVHMMIASNDAPTLEKALHHSFHKHRVNKVNLRKEFFRVELDAVRACVESQHGTVKYEADAEALEYRESLEMSQEDQEYLEKVFESIEGESDSALTED